MGLTDRRKTAKNLVDSRKNGKILTVSRKKGKKELTVKETVSKICAKLTYDRLRFLCTYQCKAGGGGGAGHGGGI